MAVRDHLQTTKSKHPIPQNVMDVEFKIVGDMTFKQFFYLCVGALLAWIISSVAQEGYWKYILLFIDVVFFIALAFIPIQQRGLDIWIVNFIKAMLSPTQRVWIKSEFTPKYLSDDFDAILESEFVDLKPKKSTRKLDEYLQSIPEQNTSDDVTQKLGKIRNIMQNIEVKEVDSVRKEIQKDAQQSRESDNIAFKLEEQVDKNNINFEYPEKVELEKNIDDTTLDKNLRKVYSSLQKSIDQAKLQVSEIEDYQDNIDIVKEDEGIKLEVPRKLIQGFIKDKSNTGVQGAMILVKKANGDVMQALQTDTEGYFKAQQEFPNDVYTLEIIKGGMAFKPVSLNTNNFNFSRDIIIEEDKI